MTESRIVRPATRVLLVRHGQSVANAGGKTSRSHQQSTDGARPCAGKGRSPNGFDCKPTLFVVSPFLRAQQTAEPLRQRFPDVPVEEWPIHEFTFLNPARHKGTSEEDRESTRRWPTGSGRIRRTSTARRPSRSRCFLIVPAKRSAAWSAETRAAASSSSLMAFSCRHSGWCCSSPTRPMQS